MSLEVGFCVQNCSSGEFSNEEKVCEACRNPDCQTCFSSNSQSKRSFSNLVENVNNRVVRSDDSNGFICLTCADDLFLLDDSCISDCPDNFFPESGVCLPENPTDLIAVVIGSAIGGIVFLVLLIIFLIFYYRKTYPVSNTNDPLKKPLLDGYMGLPTEEVWEEIKKSDLDMEDLNESDEENGDKKEKPKDDQQSE